MSHIRREQFIWEFIRIGKIPAIYSNIHYNINNYINKNCLQKNKSKVISTTLFPTFLSSTVINEENYCLKKIKHINFSGAGISISHPEAIDSFLNKNLKSQTKKNLRRSIRRLEESFNITYSYYHGFITEEKLEFLLSALKNLLQRRFDQKNIINNFLNEWDKKIDSLYDLINDNKASLFVVYDNKKPISISVNRHFEKNILFSECNGYDLDYSKFSLGHLDNYLLIKWCIENKYEFLDLGSGVVDYKKKWCNTFYDFEYHIYYEKKSLFARGMASFEINKIHIKNLIKKLKIDVYLTNIKKLLSNNDNKEFNSSIYNINTIDSINLYDASKLEELNIGLSESKNIRLPIYDYLYSNNERIDNIIVYRLVGKPNTYLFKSPKETVEIKVIRDSDYC